MTEPIGRARRPVRVVLSLVSALTLAVAGCTSSGSAGPSTGPTSGSGVASTTASTTAPTSPAAASSAAVPTPRTVASPSAPSSASAGVTLPTTPAGQQAAWIVGESSHLPITEAQAAQHFDATFLANVPVAELNTLLGQAGPVRPRAIISSSAAAIVFVLDGAAGPVTVNLSVDTGGLIGGLRFVPGTGTGSTGPSSAPSVPSTWAAVDAQIQRAVPTSRLLVAQLSAGACRPIHALDATAIAPTGSAFKLFVLDALATAVADGKISWTQQLTVTDAVKSLPSGTLQNAAAGSRVTVQQAAAQMISISDNTAADLLLGLVGQPAVERAMTTIGIAEPQRNIPFLTTKQLFALKLSDYPALANRYLALDQAGRAELLTSTVDKVGVSSLSAALGQWTTPRDPDSLEWFASPTDLCKVWAALAKLATDPKLAPLEAILSANNGGLNLPTGTWPTEWFKGGSEPGVLTLNYLVTDKSGRTYVVDLMTENAKAAIPDAATPTLLAAIAGAVQIASGEA